MRLFRVLVSAMFLACSVAMVQACETPAQTAIAAQRLMPGARIAFVNSVRGEWISAAIGRIGNRVVVVFPMHGKIAMIATYKDGCAVSRGAISRDLISAMLAYKGREA
jgi:hypothetical protein